MTILKITLIAVTLVTAVACATRVVRGDLELAATNSKRHISPVHYHIQPYAVSLQYNGPSVIHDSSDYQAESDKGNGGYIVYTQEKSKGYKSKGKGGKGKGGGGYGYGGGYEENGSSESYGNGGYGGKIKSKGYYGKGKGGSYGSSKGKGGSYGKGKGGSSYGSPVYVTKGKGKGSYGKGKGGHYGKGKGGGYGSKGKGGSYGKGKGGGIPYGSGGYSSYGIGSDGGGGGSSEHHNDQGIGNLYGTVIGTSYGVVGNSYGTVGTSYGTVGDSYATIGTSYGTVSDSYGTIGTSYGAVSDSYGISGVGYSSHGGNGGNGGSSSENNGQDSSSYGSSGGTGEGPYENGGIGENLAVGTIKEGNSDSGINADGGSGVESIGTVENQSEGAGTGVSADGGSETGSVVDGGGESGSSTVENGESGGSATGAAAAETSGKKRSPLQTISETEESLSDSEVKGGASPPASSVTITGGSGPSGKTVYNVAINTKGGTSASNDNGNNTFRVDFQTDGAGSGEKAFTVSVHFSSGEGSKSNEKSTVSPKIPAILVNPEGSTELENKSLFGKLNDEISLGGKRSISPLPAKENESKESNRNGEKESPSGVTVGRNAAKSSTSNSSSSGTKSKVNSAAERASLSSSEKREADKESESLTTKLKGENRSSRNTTTPSRRNISGNREKSGTAGGETSSDGCVSGCLSIPPLAVPSLRSESNVNSGKASASQIVSSSISPAKVRSENNDKGRVSKGSVGSNPGRIPAVKGSALSGSSEIEKGKNSTRLPRRQRPMLLLESQTSERVEIADHKDSNRTRHVPRYRPMPSTEETTNNPRTRPTSKPVTDQSDGNDDKSPSLKPFNNTTSVSSGTGGRRQRETDNNKEQTNLRGPVNNTQTSVRYLPRYNPITVTTEGTHLLVNNNVANVGKEKEESLIKMPAKGENAEEKGKSNTAGKDGRGDSVAVPPLVVPYLPVDTYYIPLRRLTRGQKKPVVT